MYKYCAFPLPLLLKPHVTDCMCSLCEPSPKSQIVREPALDHRRSSPSVVVVNINGQMAQRGRPRKTTRMDAAFDFFKDLGFPRELVRDKMNELLEVYGGDVGYPFIEEFSYKVLMEAILAHLEEERKQEEHSSNICAEGETSRKDNLMDDEMVEDHVTLAIVGTIGGNAEPVGSQIPNNAIPNNSRAQGDENSWKDIVLYETCPQDMGIVKAAAREVHLHDPPIGSPPHLIGGSSAAAPTKRRKPYHGWISDGEEEEKDDNFVILTPAIVSGFAAPPPVTPSPQEQYPVKKVF